MNEHEALEAFFAEWHRQANEYGASLTREQRDCAEEAWHAALAWLRSQGKPVAFDAWAGDEPYHVFRTEASARNYVEGLSEHHDDARVVPLYAAPQPAIPDGWKLVPMEPTEEMLRSAFYEAGGSYENTEGIYSAMLAASPQCNQGD